MRLSLPPSSLQAGKQQGFLCTRPMQGQHRISQKDLRTGARAEGDGYLGLEQQQGCKSAWLPCSCTRCHQPCWDGAGSGVLLLPPTPLSRRTRCSCPAPGRKKLVPDCFSNCKYQVQFPLIPGVWFALLLHKYSTTRCLKKRLRVPPRVGGSGARGAWPHPAQIHPRG